MHYGSGNSSNQTHIFSVNKLVTVILPEANNAVIDAVNTLGRVVSTIKGTVKVTLFALPHNGVYVIRVKSGNGIKSGKVVY